MTRIMIVLAVLAAGGALLAAVFAHGSEAAPAAEIQRTFVSTSGNDANPCTRAEPCRGFAAAMANTLPGGEVIALDSGGYGPFTANKAVSVIGAPGVHAAISAFSGSGILVAAGDSDTVVLRNLYLTGLGAETGINFQSGGSLHVESVVASGFSSHGLTGGPADARLFVRDSLFRNNGAGVAIFGTVRVEIERTRADRNGTAGFSFSFGATGSIADSSATRTAGAGFHVQASDLTISDSVSDGNSNGAVVAADEGRATLTRVVFSHNTFAGLAVFVGSPVARISDSTVTGNETGLSQTSGTLESFGDNVVRGNLTDTSGTITTVGKT